VLQVPRDNINLAGKELIYRVDHMVLTYDTFLLIIMYYIGFALSCHMIFKVIRYLTLLHVIYK
jgi:hypothetical protein